MEMEPGALTGSPLDQESPDRLLFLCARHISRLRERERQCAIGDLGNLPPLPAVVPGQMAPIVRLAPDGERELVMARWGMPGPPQYGGQPVTNIRNVASPALARMAWQGEPLHRARHFVLRVRRHEAS